MAISFIAEGPIRLVMYFHRLSAIGIRFLRLPVPAVELGLPCGWLTEGSGHSCLGQQRDSYVHQCRDAVRMGRSLYSGVVVPSAAESKASAASRYIVEGRCSQ